MTAAVAMMNDTMIEVSTHDRDILRGLAKHYMELCESDRNRRLKDEWRRFNTMQPGRPMLFANCFLIKNEILSALSPRQVENDLLAGAEAYFKRMLWHNTIGDDTVFNPWFNVEAPLFTYPEGPWGVACDKVADAGSRGWRHLPVFHTQEDLARLKSSAHEVLDSEPPLAVALTDIFGDILPVNIERHSIYPRSGSHHLGVPAGQFFGLEELLMTLYTDPEMVHEFMAFARDTVISNFRQGERAGDWSTADFLYYHTSPVCDDFPDPSVDGHGARLKDVAWFAHAQEFDAVSPGMFEEFLFEYQLPILELFGRVTYGCCETLDTKLDVLKRLPNLTKIACGPLAEPSKYPEAFGDQCTISWRPLSSIVAAPSFDEDAQRRQLREGLAKLKGCNVEIHMHEPMTVHGDVYRVRRWVQIAQEEIDAIW